MEMFLKGFTNQNEGYFLEGTLTVLGTYCLNIEH